MLECIQRRATRLEPSSLTTALEDFVTPKELDGKYCLKCSKCEKKVTASKRVTVHHVPKVFTVCLERAADHTGKKISKIVEYPEYLNLRPYMSDTAGEPLLYSLYALVVHSGDTCLDGHFFCYTKASNGLWYKMDDETVDNCGIHAVLRQQAYLLFYARCSDLKMGGMMASSLTPSYAHSFFSQWEASSEQAGSARTHGQPGRTVSMHCQRTSAREKIQNRSLQWGKDHCSLFINSTDSNNSTGRKRKRTSPPGHDHALKDGTVSEPFNSQWAPAPSGSWVQHLPRQKEQSQSSPQGYDLCRQLVEIMDYRQSVRRRRRRSWWERSPPHCDQDPKDDTLEGSLNVSSKGNPCAPSASQKQSLPRQRKQGRSPQQGYDLRRQFVENTDYHQSTKRRRKHSFGTNRQKRQRQN
ncbi:ubiquitin carboxyl-terminal hydrolase 42-like [Cyanistes caeruleus]|uniref:ubiquitin carboxyl-terminal hydrolase 42-like n=1 Tax=Cyanistes caeruleus TaxID=156563 RepID=UPI000CDB6D8D|nr:ubiquitin carboxyl-terminal hydrolase 42-like [Cyanistes caeruleus]